MIRPELVVVGLEAEDAAGAIRRLAELLAAGGYVGPTFLDAVLEREQRFPTGLPTEVPVAIPHTDAAHCLRPAIAVGVLSRPVAFGEMGNPEGRVLARVVFLLAITDPADQVRWLQKLVTAFQQPGFLERLAASEDAGDAYALCAQALG